MTHNETNHPFLTQEFNMKDKLAATAHITRKSGPWVTLAASALIIANDLRSKKNS